MPKNLTGKAKNYTVFLNERMRLWLIKSQMTDAALAKAIGVSRQCINNFKKSANDLDHPHLLAMGFALRKTYSQITFISKTDINQLQKSNNQ